MGFGIVTQHLSFYKKHGCIQFENSINSLSLNDLKQTLLARSRSGLFNSQNPLFTGPVKTLVISLAKTALFLSCERKIRLGGYFTLPCPEMPEADLHDFNPVYFTLKSLLCYSPSLLGAIIPLSPDNNTHQSSPINATKSPLDFSNFHYNDLFFIEATTSFILPKSPVLIFPFIKEKALYIKPKTSQNSPLNLNQETIESGDQLTSSTHPLITL